jgi:hypothetical protein
MALHALSLPRPREAFEPLRTSMSKHLRTSSISRKTAGKALKKIPKVVYVDRQDTSRRLVDEDHEELVEYLRKMDKKGRVEFVHGKFGNLGLKDQVLSVLDADVRSSILLSSFLLYYSWVQHCKGDGKGGYLHAWESEGLGGRKRNCG